MQFVKAFAFVNIRNANMHLEKRSNAKICVFAFALGLELGGGKYIPIFFLFTRNTKINTKIKRIVGGIKARALIVTK